VMVMNTLMDKMMDIMDMVVEVVTIHNNMKSKDLMVEYVVLYNNLYDIHCLMKYYYL